jgi:hypothetical protein
LRRLAINTEGLKMTIGAINIGTTEVQMCITVRCYPRGVWLLGAIVLLVSGV